MEYSTTSFTWPRLARPTSKLKLTFYLTAGVLVAVLLSHLFGHQYDSSSFRKLRGPPVRKVRQASTDGGKQATNSNSKDPYGNRPRIRTTNGHLIIEASQDKNIEFRTSGSRGTVTLNGIQMNQLMGVVSALDRKGKLAGTSNGTSDTSVEQYERTMRSLFTSGERLNLLESKMSDQFEKQLQMLTEQIKQMSKRLNKTASLLNRFAKQQETIVTKLKQNNCFDPNTGVPVCKNGATCVDSYDGFKCLCPATFEGQFCEQDVDECQKFRGTDLGCQNNGKCINLVGGYQCECPAQYHGVHCTTLHDDCSLSSSAALCGHGKCVNLARTVPGRPAYECVCDQGWTTSGHDSSNPACTIDVNECLPGNNLMLASSSSSSLLSSDPMMTMNGLNMSALTVPASSAAYPCSQNPFVECINLPGSFQCGPCPAGYTGNGRVCVDVDECATNNGGCSMSPLVECINLPGSRRCGPCPPGHTGDGLYCLQVSACTREPNGGCHPMAKCVEVAGVANADAARLCICQYPFAGSGIGLAGCVLVGQQTPTGPGLPSAVDAGNYTSDLINGLSNITIQLVQDDCQPNPCLNGGQCQRLDANFECICPLEWSGRLCDERADTKSICGGRFETSQGVFGFPVGGSYDQLIKLADNHNNSTSGHTGNKPNDRHYQCTWSLSGPANMALRLSFSNLLNKLDPTKKIQVHLFNETNRSGGGASDQSLHYHSPLTSTLPICAEYLDVRERLDQTLELMGAEGPLLARFCSESTGTAVSASRQKLNAQKGSIVDIISESNLIDLEYSFTATRTQFLEPSLSFLLNWSKTEPACGGELSPADSGSLSSPKFPEFYPPGTECRYIVRVPAGKRIRIQFGELTLLTGRPRQSSGSPASNTACSDSLTILDGSIGLDRPVLFRFCANNNSNMAAALHREAAGLGPNQQPIVSSSSSVTIILSSRPESTVPLMRPKQRKGFYLTYASEPATPGCGGLYTAKSATIKSLDYEPIRATSAGYQDEEQAMAVELSRYFDSRDSSSLNQVSNVGNYFQYFTRQTAALEANSSLDASLLASQAGGANKQQVSPFKTRCEFEIRPADQSRNHRIQLDWLDMPSETITEASSLSKWSRRLRCLQSRLTIFNSNPSSTTGGTGGGGGETGEVATFCSGDKYNSSLSSMLPIASSGHVLYLVYESYFTAPGTASSPSPATPTTGGSPGSRPAGFKLRYSTICTAIYQQLEDTIRTELDLEASECVYHIVLPANNSMSLLIDPNLSESMTLPDGSCAAQAIFMDGAMPRGKMDLLSAERELRLFNFNHLAGASDQLPPELVDLQEMSSFQGPDVASTSDDMSGSAQNGEQAKQTRAGGSDNNPSDETRWGYWQYASSQVHDIKEFDVCKLRQLGVESMWNHMSLMFRLNPKVVSTMADQSKPSAWRDSTSSSSLPNINSAKLQLTIRYKAEPSCGGIISEPREGSIELVSSQTGGQKSMMANPLAAGRHLDQQAKKQQQVHSCSWILRNKRPNQPIHLSFANVPIEEIKQRKSSWVSWKRSLPASSGTGDRNNTEEDADQLVGDDSELSRLLLCQQIFQEAIELYEPSVNRTRFICPTDLAESNLAFWTTQSDTVYIRLLNSSYTEATPQVVPTTTTTTTTTTTASPATPKSNQTTSRVAPISWPGKKPLTKAIGLSYVMLSETPATRQKCGGKLIQSSGVISSPRFPFNYPALSNCVWVIQAEHPRQQIRMNFTRFAMEKQTTCWFDYLEIRNGPTETSPLMGRFCNVDLEKRVLVSHSNSVWLRFRSDAHLNRAGFQMFFDGAQTGCGGVLTTPSGQIDSPNYPYASGHSADCEWTIEVSQANRIQLTIEDLDLTNGADDNSYKCRFNSPNADYLEIFDSGPEFPSKSLGKYCKLPGASRKLSFNSTSNKLFISYRSQALDYSRGFRLTYTTLCSGVQIVGTSGAIESPGYPDAYLASSWCTYLLRAPLGSNLTLALTDLELEGDSSFSSVIIDLNGPQIVKSPKTGKQSGKQAKCFTDRLRIWSVKPKASTPLAKLMEPIVLPDKFATHTNSTAKVTAEGTVVSSQFFDFRLEQVYCGSMEQFIIQEGQEKLSLDLNTNLVLVEFKSDRALELRGFRLEWRSRDVCGAAGKQQQVRSSGSSLSLVSDDSRWEPISFDERLNVSSSYVKQQPYECLWLLDLSRFTQVIEFDLTSDMRSPETVTSSSALATTNNDEASCDEASLTMYDGPDQSAPILTRNCNQKKPHETLHASSNKVLVRYFSNGRHGTFGRSFTLNSWPGGKDPCSQSYFDLNTPFLRPAGVRKSPNYPELYEAQAYKCTSLISSSVGGRLRFTIDEIDIPSGEADQSGDGAVDSKLLEQEKCKKSGNYVLIRSVHNSASPVVEYFCGKFDRTALGPNDARPARTVVVLEQATAWFDFYTKTANQRGRWKVTYDRLCGSFVRNINMVEEYASPNYPSAPNWPDTQNDNPMDSENVCIWRFNSRESSWAKKSGSTTTTNNKIHLSLVNFVDPKGVNRSPSDCLRVYEGVEISLKQSRFNLTELDAKFQPKLKICSQNDIRHTSLYYVSLGSEITVLITGNAVAKFRVRPVENFCGGDYQLQRAEFASPDYPQPYGTDLDCHYFISSSPGSVINLKFTNFDLPEGDNEEQDQQCDNVDHIEVRQMPTKRRVALKQKLLYRQSVSDSGLLNWFLPHNSASQPGKLNQSSTLTKKLNETYQKTVERLFELSRLYHIMYYSGSSNHQLASKVVGQNDRLSMRLEQFYSNSQLVGRFCGKKAPILKPDQLQDELLLRFRSHGSPKGKESPGKNKKAPLGFLASYKIEYGGSIQLLDDKSMNEDNFVSSPMFPEETQFNSSIRWTFETKPEFVFQFELVALTLGSTRQDCQDTLRIYDGLNQAAQLLSELCGHLSFKRLLSLDMADHWLSAYNGSLAPSKLPIVHAAHDDRIKFNLLRPVRTSSNVASVVYDNLSQRGAFLLRYRAIKRSELADNSDLLLNYNSSSIDLASRPIEPDQQLVDQFETSGSGGPSKSCTRLIQLSLASSGKRNLSDQVELTSPDYPNEVPFKEIECHWLIFTHDNTNIQLIIDPTSSINRMVADSTDQTTQRGQSNCFRGDNKKNFIVVHDGASTLAPVLARQCLPAPPIQLQSSGRHLLIRYVHSELSKSPNSAQQQTDESQTRQTTSIFRASARVGKCGGQYHATSPVKIRHRYVAQGDSSAQRAQQQQQQQKSPGGGSSYGNNLDCVYYIFASTPEQVLVILPQMGEFDLSNKPTNADCSVGDYIEIRELPIQSDRFDFSTALVGRSLGRFCAGKPFSNQLESPSSAISIEFHTDEANVAKGFELFIMSSEPRSSCPRGYQMLTIDEPYGRLSSPNWPHGFLGRRRCKYNLVAPSNKSIEVTFVRLRRPENELETTNRSSRCADTIDYMADNEALSFRYDFRPLREVRSSISGTLIRKLVKEVPCKPYRLWYGFDVDDTRNPVLTGSDQSNGSTPIGGSFTKINPEEYRKLLEAAPFSPIIIQTNSHVLSIEYSANNLLPNEGFLAIFELNDLAPEDVCGGEIYAQPGKNILESARFNQVAKSTDINDNSNYIQCEWSLKLDANGFDFSDGSRDAVRYNLLPTDYVGQFKTSFLVFQVLETPSLEENFTLVAEEWSIRGTKSRETCGLTRLLIDGDHFAFHSLLACGNLTMSYKWMFIGESSTNVMLRTKNLPVKSQQSSQSKEQQQQQVSTLPFYRGLRAFFFETSCLKLERLVGESLRIRSHMEFETPTNNKTTTAKKLRNYEPGICKWHIRLSPGQYEINVAGLNLRKPKSFSEKQNSTRSCEPDKEIDLDYIEFKSSTGSEAPVLARFCAYNQAASIRQHKLVLNSTSELVIIFVAGLEELMQNNDIFTETRIISPPVEQPQLGFDLQVTRVKNSTQNGFCTHSTPFNIYQLIRNKERAFYMIDYYDGHISSTSLYAKNAHCQVDMSLDDEFRFNLTFTDLFDIESSKNCTNDYIQIEDLFDANEASLNELTSRNVNSTNTSSKKTTTKAPAKSPTSPTTTTMLPQLLLPMGEYKSKLIGRWCGRNIPKGNFISTSNKIRVVFHSNDRIEGKGFLLEWAAIQSTNLTNQIGQ